VEERNLRKEKLGKVISDKMDKTIIVAVERTVKHPLYNRRMKKTTKLMVHDEDNSCNIGDTVRVMETRPLSRQKRWRVVEIVERAK
jgi:small subunit ribosomal protein S17